MPRKFVALGVLGASLLGAAAAGAAVVRSLTPAEGALPSGLRVAGLPLAGAGAGAGDLDRTIRERTDEVLARKVSFVIPKTDMKPERVVATVSLSGLGASIDRERTARLARSAVGGSDFFERVERTKLAEDGGVDVPLALSFDRAKAMAVLDDIKEGEDLDPVSARLDLATRGVVPERPGHYLDAHLAADKTFLLAAALARGNGNAPAPAELRVELQAQSFPARMTTDYVRAIDVSHVLAQYDTYFSRSGDQARRAKNIEVAAAKLNGLILPPGEMFSFNAIVGDRSEENGFERSWEIFKGEMKEGVGGGTCQVASTFHAAALFAGIEILERLPHSRPSAYIPLGLDATVVYPVVDMKMRNAFSFPVALHSTVEKNRLRIEVLGPRKPGRVSFEREVLETLPYSRKIEEDPLLPGDKVLVKQHGIRGFRIKRTRELTMENGKKRVETTRDFYPPTLEIFKVAPGFDVSKLPPLPFETDVASETPGPAAPAAAAFVPAAGLFVAAAPVPVTPAGGDAAVATSAAPADYRLVDAPGAHAPTKKQSEPEKTIKIRR